MENVIIPEVTVFNILESCFDVVRLDYHQHVDERNTLLYSFFGSLPKFRGKLDWFTQAKDLFLRDEKHPRKIETEMFFNSERVRVPTVHITLPSERAAEDGIGFDQGYQPPVYDELNFTYKHTVTRMFEAQYQLLITSDNTLEVQMIYALLRNMLMSIFEHVELEGLRNPKLGGMDLQIDSTLVPEHVYTRALTISTSYEITVPVALAQKIAFGFQVTSVPKNKI